MDARATSERLRPGVSAAAAAFLCVLYLVRLGAGSLWDNSEPQYGEIVKEMLRGGDWVTLHKDLQPWFIHPPLWFWVTAASAKAFGLTEFALRFPSALFGVACALVAYAAARRLYGDIAGVTAMAALGTSLEMLVMGRLAIQDTMLIFCMSIAGFWSFFAVRDGDRRALLIAAVAAALGTLVKGPVAALVPFLTLLTWLAWTRRWRDARALPWLPALAVYVVIAGSWFAVESALYGGAFLGAYFGLSNVGRFLSPFENQPGPPWFYLPYLIVGFVPFVAYAPQAVVRAWRVLGDDGRYMIAAVAVPFVFFSIAQTKLPNYIAIAFPALAVMVGAYVASAPADARRTLLHGVGWFVAALAVIGAAAAYYLRAHPTAAGPYGGELRALLAWCLFVASAGMIAFAATRRPIVAVWGLAATMAAFIAVTSFVILPSVEATAKPMKAMAADVMRHQRPGERICFSGVKQGFSLDYYTEGPPVQSIGHNTGDVAPKQYFGDPAPALCVVSPSAYDALAAEGFRMRIIERTPTLWLTEYPARNASRW